MKKNAALFFLLSKYSIKATLQQPLSIFVLTLGKLLRFGMFFLFLYYLVAHTKVLAGYTLNQTIIFFLSFYFIDSVGQLLFREVYRFKPLVVSGEFDSVLVKPYHPFLRVLTGGVDLMDMITLVPYAALLIFFISQETVTASALVLYLLFIINSLVIVTAFHIFVLALGVLFAEVDNAINMYRDLTRLALVPVDIYREPFRFIITYIIPIGITMTIPAKILFNALSFPLYIISVIIACTSLGLALYLWSFALKKYQSWGG